MALSSTNAQKSSVGSDADFRTGGRWFDPRLVQYSFRGLIHCNDYVGSSQWLGKNIVFSQSEVVLHSNVS